MPIGYWETEHLLRPADHTVVGAGIVGMSAALGLKRARPDAHVRLLERSPLSAGGTTRNAGFACFGSAGEWLDDLEALGAEELGNLIRMRAEGLTELVNLLGADAIGLQWTACPQEQPSHPGEWRRPAQHRNLRAVIAMPT